MNKGGPLDCVKLRSPVWPEQDNKVSSLLPPLFSSPILRFYSPLLTDLVPHKLSMAKVVLTKLRIVCRRVRGGGESWRDRRAKWTLFLRQVMNHGFLPRLLTVLRPAQ